MGECMPKEQQLYIDTIEKECLKKTNMKEHEAHSFAFRCWQLGYSKVEKSASKKIIKETVVTGLHDNNKATYKCPHCKKHFNNVAIQKLNYCYHCGGRLERI